MYYKRRLTINALLVYIKNQGKEQHSKTHQQKNKEIKLKTETTETEKKHAIEKIKNIKIMFFN